MDEDDINGLENDGVQHSSFPHGSIGAVPEGLKRRRMPHRIANKSIKRNPKDEGIDLSKSLDTDKNSNNPLASKFKRKSDVFSRLKQRRTERNEDDTEKKSDDEHEDLSEGTTVLAKSKKIILMIKIGIVVGVIASIGAIILFVGYFIMSIFGISFDFSNLGSNVNLDPTLPYYNEAKKYHENLNKAVTDYSESCGIFLNKSYIHATLTYLWNISDMNYNEKQKYQLMADNVDDVAKLMVTNCVVDYEIGGSFYNKLLTSSFLKRYYSTALKYMESETIVKGIFEYTELGIDLARLGSGYINDNLKVTMGTCERPYNKKLVNEGSNYSSTIGFADYLKGVIYGEVTGSIKTNYIEFLKAHVIAATSVALGNSKYQSGDEEIWVHNGTCWQVSCDINEGCTLCNDFNPKATTALTGNNRSCNSVSRRVPPIPDDKRKILDQVFEEVYGIVMLNNDGSIKIAQYRDKVETCGSLSECMGQIEAARDANMGMTYQEILEKYYDNFTLSNISEDSYAGDVSYNTGGYSGKVVFYDQNDYYNYKFCGLNVTIKSAGCGPTAMAIVLSTFVDKKYTPPVVMEEAYAGKYCGKGIDGTNSGFFSASAKKHGLAYSSVSKSGDKQLVLDALKSGKSLVIAHMGPGKFTSGGHYIVLSAVRSDGKVYVYDPFHKSNSINKERYSGNGWYDFNDIIVKQLKGIGEFHIITKR